MQPVPVKFVSINAHRKDETTGKLIWTVAQESDMRLYDVERSQDGMHFVKISEKAPQNNSLVAIYNFTDDQINKTNWFYRIKALGNDGSYFYSQIVNLNELGNSPSIAVIPNPVTNKLLHLQCISLNPGFFNVKMLNAIGQVIQQLKVQMTSNTGQMTIPLKKSITSGSYLVIVEDADGMKYTATFVIE